MNKIYKRIRRMQDMINRYNRAGYYHGQIDFDMSDKIFNVKTAIDREICKYCKKTGIRMIHFYQEFPELDKKIMALKYECYRISELLSGERWGY